MKEREQILELWRALRQRQEQAVLVTVVKTLGSSYRRPGARLLLARSGERAGSISGGCLEDDLIKKAFWLTEQGAVVRRYDTTPDGEIGPSGELSGGFGLGCNGIIYLLLERVHGGTGPTSLDLLETVYSTREPATLTHVLAPPKAIGTYTTEDVGHLPGVHGAVATDNVVTQLASGEEVFFETLNPPLRLLVFGGGDDARPLTELGRQLGWQVEVFDGRAHYARSERFPHARQVCLRAAGLSLDDLSIDCRSAAVIMTHSYSQDLHYLRALARSPVAYLGLLGPRNRSEQLLLDADLSREQLPILHGPAGLDIGADGPEQVALSIVAEIQASVNCRDGGPLRERSGSIHSRAADGSVTPPFLPGVVCA